MVGTDYILNFVKEFNDFEDSSIFDRKLRILINASIGKLENEGIPNEFMPNTPQSDAYCLCIARNVAMMLNPDIDYDMQSSMYLTDVNELRTALLLNPR